MTVTVLVTVNATVTLTTTAIVPVTMPCTGGKSRSSIVQGIAKRVPLAEFAEQNEGQKGMKAISLDVGDSLVAMHAFSFQGTQ